jgi:energy-coupling factor transporter transmembrane protein EcfT
MNKQCLKDALGWGTGLWFIGYILGIILFMFVPANMIGWVISLIGIIITLWVLLKKVKGEDTIYYLKIAVAWTVIAVVFDYLFLVKLFNPAGGYYKLDVYFYYVTMFVLPLLVGIFKTKKKIPSLIKKQMADKELNKKKILDGIEMQKSITNDVVQNLLGVSDATATRYLEELEKDGKIRQVGERGPGVFYEKV